MTRLLIRLFVRDYQNIDDPQVRERYGKFSGLVGIVTNLFLFAGKITVGLLFHSISVTADAVNNLTDSVSSIVTLVGFKMAAKPADSDHPYGHARIEYISGLMVSLVVFVTGFQFAQTSINKIIRPEQSEFSLIVVAVLVCSILLKAWQGAFYRRVGKTISSSTISATAADSMNDVLATSAVLVGAVLTRLTGFNLDGYMGLVVAVMIMFTGFQLVRETGNPLLGEAPTREFVDDIYRTISAYDGILGIHDLNVHSYGPGRCFATVHCEVPAERDILLSHDIIDNIERDFLEKKGIHLVIHMDPVTTNDPRTNELKRQITQLIAEISPEIGMHDFRVVWGPTHANLVFDICVSFGFPLSDEELVRQITERVRGVPGNCYPVITVDHDYVPTRL
ncbi:Ferrous-iron efflux pump FieF [Caprobacter fermentans]|uniref:Ferrous-iron efflux pump FieF n=1 Tax=Caproicibacter fermentans TaxID=2576756 RepID=A0A6N8HXJ0_9FIRM|nr:cation diffusion facilitator family transporter [Caproicibacter fermentans]MVB10574.1 Ferrous-iron efflux pump FieF [Caproicibacter fermentans]OCN00961.1 cation diffusion facilitator family transporter [Clostridium sp. W14A]